MFLELINNNGRKYIRLVESNKILDKNSNKRVPRKKTVLNVGFLSKFDDGDPEYFERLKASFKSGHPLIKTLEPFVDKGAKKDVYELKIYEGTDDCIGHPKLIANSIIEKILEELDLAQLIRTYKQHYGVTYDVYGFFKLMLFGRILNPASKISTINQNSDYYTSILKEDYYKYNIYDTLDFVNKHKHALFSRINKTMVNKFGRTTNYLFYDVTNFFFETDKQDEDMVCEDGTVIAGLRKEGVSKEHRDTPIVQMGLIMDEQGVPISIEQFSGNTLDQLTVKKTFDNSVDSIKNSRFVFVGDKGFSKGPNLVYLISNNNGYIISKSVRGSTKDDRNWMKDPNGYVKLSENFKYKSRIVLRKHTLTDGRTINVPEKQVTYWSKKYFNMELVERKEFYDTVSKILDNPASLNLTKTQKSTLSKYIDKNLINKHTGESISSQSLIASLDMNKLNEDYDLLGYYTIVTSETALDDLEIINKYHELVKIEDEFRIMKSTLNTRPIFLRTPEHIMAHLVICTIALIVIRLIQRQIKLKNPKDSFNVFYEGLSANRIVAALNKFKVEKLDEFYYRFNDLDDPDLSIILSSFGINLPLKLFKLGELKQLKSSCNLSL